MKSRIKSAVVLKKDLTANQCTMKTKKSCYGRKINMNFHDNKTLKEGFNCNFSISNINCFCF